MAYDYSEIRQQQRKNEEDPEKHEHDHEWGNVKGQANVSSSSSSLSVERKRHQRLYFRRHRGVTNEYPGTTDTGCFHDLLHICSNFLHLFYIIFGLALLGYSMAIFLNPHASQWQLWHIFPTILMIWSIFLLLAGSLGIHGLRSLICRRYGLIISAYFGIVLIIWESALVIYFIIEKQSFLEFLRLRETKFYLTEREIGAFDQNSTSFILIFLALVLEEVHRYYMLRHLRSEMLTHDNATIDTQRRDEARQKNLEIRRWKTTVRSGDGGELSTQDYDESRTFLLPCNGVGQSGLISPPRQKLGLVTPPLNETPTSGNIECGRPGLAPAPLSPSNTSRKDSSHQRFSTNPTLPGSQNTYLRTLTSTAAERKRTVAACRALRAQIARFEDAFIHLHGRAPKGATERAPLATTYAQYREWKRAIRADAASRIQALSRGARTRSLLMENIDPRFKEIVTKRAGRPGRKSVQDLQHLAIPTNITGTAATSGRSKPLPMNNSGRRDSNDAYYGVEVFYQEPSNGAPNRPASDWNSSRDSSSPSTRTSSRDDDFSWSVSTSGPQHHYSSRNDSMSTSSQPSYINMTFAELQTRKRELKQQLKQYDMNFFNQHGRMPVKVEKEPIRHLYENYNSLKNRISATAHEREGPPITPIIPTTRPTPPPVTHNYAETNGNVDNFLPIASTSSSEKTGKWKGSRNSAGTVTTAGSSSGGNPINLAGLKTEKQTLHQMLRSYEKDFFNLHSRQVSCYADIRPVASQYRRYKEIKKQISALQETGAVQK